MGKAHALANARTTTYEDQIFCNTLVLVKPVGYGHRVRDPRPA